MCMLLGSGSVAPDAGQQDVSEFQHKLLEWLEDAFKPEDQYVYVAYSFH